jgi:hypothetical protein
VVVATSALGLLFGAFPIVVSSFAIFFGSYVHEFHGGRAAIALALTIHNIVAAFLAARIERVDRLVLLSAHAIGSKIWQLDLLYAIFGVVGSDRFGTDLPRQPQLLLVLRQVGLLH